MSLYLLYTLKLLPFLFFKILLPPHKTVPPFVIICVFFFFILLFILLLFFFFGPYLMQRCEARVLPVPIVFCMINVPRHLSRTVAVATGASKKKVYKNLHIHLSIPTKGGYTRKILSVNKKIFFFRLFK